MKKRRGKKERKERMIGENEGERGKGRDVFLNNWRIIKGP